MNKEQLIEQIETKIEEFKENCRARTEDWGGNYIPEDHQFDEGAIAGLKLALELVRGAE